MWELRVANPLGGLSPRKFFVLAAIMIAAIFAFIFATAPTAHAADAQWKGDSIMYGGNQYDPIGEAKEGDTHGITPKSKIYAYVEQAEPGTSTTMSKGHLIYFAPGVDPPKATSATYATFDYESSNYTNQSGTKSISLTVQSESDKTETTSCMIKGIGWIVCPVSTFLAEAMDSLFGVLASFLVVGPVQTNPDNSLFRAWAIMRNFANVAFVIAFLIIIYSQLTNLGLSSYGIKHMLPRLIIAAILVNISYWVCAIAIDLSNIAGYSLQDIFMGIRDDIVGGVANSQATSWESVTTAALAGTTLLTASGISLVAAGGIGAAIYMLLPVLVGVLIAALVAILIMAARQALITILVIIAPLAFVAYLLPNTEKYFEKWQKLFMTMLMMFPIFAVLFGGAQLAGSAIIQNAGSIIILILGMAVQVAPLVVLPFLLKFSGSLLGQIAGMANNKSKGLVDRTRNYAQEKADLRKSQVLANPNLRRHNLMGRAVQKQDANRREREGWKQANEAEADARWANSSKYQTIQQASMRAALSKSVGERTAEAAFEKSKHTNAAIQELDINARAVGLQLDLSKAKVEANWGEIKAGRPDENMVTPEGLSASALATYVGNRRAQAAAVSQDTLESGIQARRAHSAEEVQKEHLTNALLSNVELQKRAGGVAGQLGADAALADAIKGHRSAHNEAVDDAKQLLKHFNPDGGKRQDLAMGRESIEVKDDAGRVIQTFSKDSKYVREAVIEAQLAGEGSYKEIQEIIAHSGSDGLKEFATTIGSAIPQYKIADKAAFLSGQTIDEVKQGKIKSMADLDNAILRNIQTDKIRPEHLATNDVLAVQEILRVARANQSDPAFAPHIAELGNVAHLALNNTSLSGKSGTNVKKELAHFIAEWPPTNPTTRPPAPPTP